MLIDNYIVRLIALGYTEPDINDIVMTIARNQPYQLGSSDYNYMYEDLERMISELENFFQGDFSTAIRMYPIDMIDREVAHLFPPNPFNQPVIFLMHGWGIDGAQQNAYIETADWFMQQFGHLDINQQPILIGIDWDGDYAEAEPDPDTYPEDVLDLLLNFGQIIEALLLDIRDNGAIQETLELSDVLFYGEIENRARATGDHLGFWIEKHQVAYAESLSMISHSMGAHVALQIVESANVDVDNLIVIQAPMAPYDETTGLIDGFYNDILAAEVDNVFITHNESDLAMTLYQVVKRIIYTPLYPIGAVGATGLWEGWTPIDILAGVFEGAYREFQNVTNFEITKSPEDEGSDVKEHQVMDLSKAWKSVRDFVSGIFDNLFGLLNL